MPTSDRDHQPPLDKGGFLPSIEQMTLGMKIFRSIQAVAWDEGARAKRDFRGELIETNPYREDA